MFQGLIDFFTKDPIEEAWQKRKVKAKRVLFEFENGRSQELTGEAADEWYHDLHRKNCGRAVNWKRHIWHRWDKELTMPYVAAFVDFSKALTEFGESSKALERMNINSTRETYDKAKWKVLDFYNIILTQLQEAKILPE